MNFPYKINGYVDARSLWRLLSVMRREKRSEAFVVRDAVDEWLDRHQAEEPTDEELAELVRAYGDKKRIRGQKKKVEGDA